MREEGEVDSDALWKSEEYEVSLFGFEMEEGRSVAIFVGLQKVFFCCFFARVLAAT